LAGGLEESCANSHLTERNLLGMGRRFLTCTLPSRYEEFLSWCLPPQQNKDKPPQLLGLVPTSASFTVSMRVCSWPLYMFTCILRFFACFAHLMSSCDTAKRTDTQSFKSPMCFIFIRPDHLWHKPLGCDRSGRARCGTERFPACSCQESTSVRARACMH